MKSSYISSAVWSFIYETVFSAENSLENLAHQDQQINTILNNTETINHQLSISERILKTMNSFFYRINYTKESIDSPKKIPKKIIKNNIDKNIDFSLLDHLKYLNLEIGSELTKQNENLLKISNNIDNSELKLKTIDILF